MNMIDKDEYFMDIALKEANKARRREEVPVGAIIVQKGKIIARGHNMREIKGDITKHAELIAIRRANRKLRDWRLNDCTIYVTLFPCSMCASAILQSRISRIVIGAPTKDNKNKKIVDLLFEKESNKPLIEITENILEDECSKLLKEFFKEQRKIVKNK